ncbi:MAG: MgtC/SapB family protein [Prevotella sp.]|nr:MgtC/SapB family protein [Prevotella sp.]
METEYLVRLFVAALLGGVIGLDREYNAKDAGFRTHFLVALGSALFMLVSQFGFPDVVGQNGYRLDPSRVAAQVVSGIGFIGAGTIIFQKHVLKGLTTAAGIWCTAAIGLACGSGLYVWAAVATLLALICLEAFNFFLRRFGARTVSLRLTAASKENVLHVIEVLERAGLKLSTYHMERLETATGHHYSVQMDVRVRRDRYITRLLELMRDFDGVSIDNVE